MGMIQIRNVPDGLHRELKDKAARSGMTLSDYLRIQIEEIARRPSLAELLDRLETRSAVQPPEPAARLIERERIR